MAIKLTNRAEFVVLLFASWRLGATVTPVNPKLTDVEVSRQLKDSGARLAVVEDCTTAEGGITTLAVDDLDENTESYKRPTAYVVVDAIPKNAVGEIDKIAVRAAHAAATAGS